MLHASHIRASARVVRVATRSQPLVLAILACFAMACVGQQRVSAQRDIVRVQPYGNTELPQPTWDGSWKDIQIFLIASGDPAEWQVAHDMIARIEYHGVEWWAHHAKRGDQLKKIVWELGGHAVLVWQHVDYSQLLNGFVIRCPLGDDAPACH